MSCCILTLIDIKGLLELRPDDIVKAEMKSFTASAAVMTSLTDAYISTLLQVESRAARSLP